MLLYPGGRLHQWLFGILYIGSLPAMEFSADGVKGRGIISGDIGYSLMFLGLFIFGVMGCHLFLKSGGGMPGDIFGGIWFWETGRW